MSNPYLGEVRLVGFNYAPAGWAFCNGAQIGISQNNALYNLIGTTYGGNGTSVFNLPNLQGRIPIHQGTATNGSTYVIGEISGSETVTLLTPQIPVHNHPVLATANPGTTAAPVTNCVPGTAATVNIYHTPATVVPMSAASGVAGGNQPHENIMPFQCVNYIISLFGIFPSQ